MVWIVLYRNVHGPIFKVLLILKLNEKVSMQIFQMLARWISHCRWNTKLIINPVLLDAMGNFLRIG